ncbi:MAG: sulfur carrier protein ThiS [Chthoniobacterales bacterium]
MTVFVNGERRELQSARTVAALVEELGFPAPTLLIEHNGTALTRSEWPSATLTEGDRIELLRVTAGG